MKVLIPAAVAALLVSSVPALALQTVTLPPDSDGYVPFENPDAQPQDKLTKDETGGVKVDGLGSFHFSVTRDSGWPGDPGYYYKPGSSSSAGYGTSTVPGSEFYNSGYPFAH